MSAPADEVMRRGARLARLKQAGVHNAIDYVRSEAETRAAIALAEARRLRVQAERETRPVPAPPKRRRPAPPPRRPCSWCGGATPCEEHDDLEGDPSQPWVPRALPRERGTVG